MSIYSERGVSYEKGTKRATSWVRLRTGTAGRKKTKVVRGVRRCTVEGVQSNRVDKVSDSWKR